MTRDRDLADQVAEDASLWREFEAICDCGGRLAGTPSERQAVELVERLAREASGVEGYRQPVPYAGWSASRAELRLPDGTGIACYPLLRSMAMPAGGLTAPVVDLGRGAPEDFEAHAADLPGRIALVRHELMFAAGTIHRSRKYEMARAADAVGFLIAGPLEHTAVAGSSGRTGRDGIPAMGISRQGARCIAHMAETGGEVTLVIETREAAAEASNLLVDLPGRDDEWVVLSAHLDGHEISESAMDNASGIAAVLAAARALAPKVAGFRRGLRIAFFNVEEWALTGSAHHVERLPADVRARIALNVNLDSVAGSLKLTALTSGYAALGPFLQKVAAAKGIGLALHQPLMMNSDHANFACAGIPAFRLVAGFDEPDANPRFVLTSEDNRDKVAIAELRQAARLAAAIVEAACNADAEEVASWRKHDSDV